MGHRDYYEILGVTKQATQDDIRRAYRKLARRYHPDVSKEKDTDLRFKEINEAHDVLKDHEKRKAYDIYGENWQYGDQQESAGFNDAGGFAHDHEGFSSGFRFSGDNSSGFGHDFRDIFGDFLGRGNRRSSEHSWMGSESGVERGLYQAELNLSLAELLNYSVKVLTFSHIEPDPSGVMRRQEKTIKVRIPKGVTDGSVIRVPLKKDKGPGTHDSEVILLTIRLAPDPRFHVSGYDLHTVVSVTPWEAALGGRVVIETVNGQVNLTIPQGTNSGSRLRVKGKGLPRKNSGAGDIIVEIIIKIPEQLSDEERRLFTELAEKSKFKPAEQERQKSAQPVDG